MAVLAPPVQVVTANAPPFVHVPSGAPPFVVTTGAAPPIQIVASGAPPITLFNEDGSIWSAGGAAVGGAGLLVGEANGFATDFTYATDASRVAVKAANVTTNYAVDAFYQNAGTSPKMVYDAAGVLGWSPHNLLLQSQAFDTGNWPKVNGSVSANATTAPDGSATADIFTPTAGSAVHSVYEILVLTSAATYSLSVHVKAVNAQRYVSFIFQGNGAAKWVSATFDLQTATVTEHVNGADAGNVYTNSGISSVGSGWYRLTLTGAVADVTGYFAIEPCNSGTPTHGAFGDITWTANGTDGVALWGAQLNLGSVATAYLPTTTAARVGLAIDYDPVTHAARGLWSEPQATNLALQSGAFDNAAVWSKVGSTVGANAIIAPDGTLQADASVPDTGSVLPYIFQSITTSAATAYTFSCYLKNGTLGTPWCQLTVISSTTWRSWFNLSTGAKGSAVGSPTSYNIVSVGNGWYRADITVTVGSTSTIAYIVNSPADGDVGVITGNGTSPSVYLWGAQLETGTIATSYIPTAAATVTRAADQVKVTPASINYSAIAGSWWTEVYHMSDQSNGRIISYSPGVLAPIYQSSGTSNFSLFDGTALTRTVSTFVGVTHKVAAAFASGDRAITADGLAVVADAGPTAGLLAPSTINFGHEAGANQMQGYIRKLRYVPRRKTNPELVTETT